MKPIVTALLLIFLLIGCKENTSYVIEIRIKNSTNDSIKVTLYPKEEWMVGNKYYNGEGNFYEDTTCYIQPNKEEVIYYGPYSNLTPPSNELVLSRFDSIYIRLSDKSWLKFSSTRVVGYAENLFDADAEWVLKKRKFVENDSFWRPIESSDYSFVISEDKITK